ncbi:MAG TPA: ParB/RepB/Spo0J family partition protein [Gemmatimonadaceae bacterium]|nr:ParB/RepB/Spo0J family partition protein [Gemmatimonadaceae bacterium]
MATEKPGRRLGRGLDALLGSASREHSPADGLRRLAISDIKPNPLQPRKQFAPEELTELQQSLSTHGMLQPVTVRTSQSGRGYELIAGERRFRAATALGWKEIPALVKDVDDSTLLALALIENLQRADLNPIEEAEGYKRLTLDFGMSQAQVAELVGKNRSTVANLLRLLELPAAVQQMVQNGQLTTGHVRALLALKDDGQILAAARNILDNQLNVREVEASVRTATKRPKKATKDSRPPGSAFAKSVEDKLRKHLQTDVHIRADEKGKGDLTIRFYSHEDFERILETVGIRTEELL